MLGLGFEKTQEVEKMMEEMEEDGEGERRERGGGGGEGEERMS